SRPTLAPSPSTAAGAVWNRIVRRAADTRPTLRPTSCRFTIQTQRPDSRPAGADGRLRMRFSTVTAAALIAAACAGCQPAEQTAAQAPAADDAALTEAIAALETAVAEAELEVERLKSFDELENLAGVYGHYVDKSMQDDIADLFTDDGVVEILGRGVYLGQDRVREYMHNLG